MCFQEHSADRFLGCTRRLPRVALSLAIVVTAEAVIGSLFLVYVDWLSGWVSPPFAPLKVIALAALTFGLLSGLVAIVCRRLFPSLRAPGWC
ncbi:MAG: hypothetical protein HY909_20510 [Deltaproteobacteria bacterium]|nr:hypothetical protein [Deltaproteobacteria bacterium]